MVNKLFYENLFLIKKNIFKTFTHKENYVFRDPNKNTVLLIEPRLKREILIILANTYNQIGPDWNYVFYCGKDYANMWKKNLPNFIDIRPLNTNNFSDTRLYSDFCKNKNLWENLYGDFVLTIQTDTWIKNIDPYNISYFTELNKSYIGGNMAYKWSYFNKINLHHTFRNFNGGLSLRKRKDMIKIINAFPPLKTTDNQTNFLSEHEDVYFTMGCIKLNLPIGDDEKCSHFSLHTIYHNKYFGIHQPMNQTLKNQIILNNPFLNKNIFLK